MKASHSVTLHTVRQKRFGGLKMEAQIVNAALGGVGATSHLAPTRLSIIPIGPEVLKEEVPEGFEVVDRTPHAISGRIPLNYVKVRTVALRFNPLKAAGYAVAGAARKAIHFATDGDTEKSCIVCAFAYRCWSTTNWTGSSCAQRAA